LGVAALLAIWQFVKQRIKVGQATPSEIRLDSLEPEPVL